MNEIPGDVLYAYLRLGVASDAPPEALAILQQAEAYRYIGRERLKCVRRFAGFLIERRRLGLPDEPFGKIRKSYYKKAMALHPDRGAAGKTGEEELKAINAAYELVEAIYREAQHYFRQDADVRAEIEQTAVQDWQREARVVPEPDKKPPPPKAEPPATDKPAQASPAAKKTAREVRFFAASVPRYIRNARLPTLGRDAVIGSRLFKTKDGQSLVYDIIMLPEQEFMRAKLYLSLTSGQNSSLELSMSKMTPAYMPMDTKGVVVPPGESNPWHFARAYFIQEFKIDSD